ncbi:hypothetical protein [Microbacterium sp.]|uniref:hypothetical protein n=1 Tax=Microbacterium sp. TaxID=51671 RepID=UPI003C75DDF6
MSDSAGEPTWENVLRAAGQRDLLADHDRLRLLLACWTELPESAFAKRCVVAHYLADLHREPTGALDWDLRALEAYRWIDHDDLVPLGIQDPAAFAPSIHLNVGDDYFALGMFIHADNHARAAEDALGRVASDPLNVVIGRGVAALRERVKAALAEDER